MNRPNRILIGLLVVLATARVLLAIFTPLFDPSEGRYAVLCANMARDGDFLVPHFIHEGVFQSFDGKPPLLFQLGGLACLLLGKSAFAVRLPCLLAAGMLLAILYATVRQMKDRTAAGLAVGICASTVAFFADAGFCMTDMLLVLCVSGALLLECQFNDAPTRRLSLGVFALLGLGMLVKGPVALALFGLPVLLDAGVNHRWSLLRRHDWLFGPLLFLALAAPWYLLMERATPGFLKYFFVHENLLRFLVHDYGDKYGAGRETFRGMALVWAIVATLPWTPFALFHLRKARPGFLVLGLLSITGFWCLTSRVPLAYLFPVIPLFAAWLAIRAPAAHVRRALPLACGLAVLVVTSALAVCQRTTSKMPGAFFQKELKVNPQATFAFVGKSPYSAEFYFGRRLHARPQPGDVLFKRQNHKWQRITP